MRVFSIVTLALFLVARADEGQIICPSLAVEKEKWENEKLDALSAAREKYIANVSALQAEHGEQRKKLEDEKLELAETLQRSTTESDTWREKMTAEMKKKDSEHKSSLTELRKQISAQKQTLAESKENEGTLKQQFSVERKSLEGDLAKLKEQLIKSNEVKDTEHKASIMKLRKQLEAQKVELVESKEKGTSLESKLKHQDGTVISLESKLKQQDGTVKDLREQLIKSNEEAQKSQQDHEALARKFANEKGKFANEKESLIAAHASDLKELRDIGESTLSKKEQKINARMSNQKKELDAKTSELATVANELSETNEKFLELRRQNTKVLKENEVIGARFEEKAKLLEQMETDFTSIRAKQVDERAKLKRKAEGARKRSEAQKKKLRQEIENMHGDVLFSGSWVKVPKGWNGVIALDLRPLRNIWVVTWSRFFNWEKAMMRVPKQYRELFSNGAVQLKKIPSLGEVTKTGGEVISTVYDFSNNVVREYSPFVKDGWEIILRTWKVSSVAAYDFYYNTLQPYLAFVSTSASKLYIENEIGQLYVDPMYQLVADAIQPIYKDSFLPLYTEHVHPILENVPHYRSQMETSIVQLQKDVGTGWRKTKKSFRIVKSDFTKQFAFYKRTFAKTFSLVSVDVSLVINKLSAPLVLFGGKLTFEGGVFEAALVATAVLLVAWYSARFLGVILGVAWFFVCFAYAFIRILLTILLKLVVYTIVWRIIVVGSVFTVFYLVSFLFRVVGFVLKVIFFPIKVGLTLAKCALKLMCCCGLCCRGESKLVSSTPPKAGEKGKKEKPAKVTQKSTTESATSSDEGKNKQSRKKRKKRKGNGSKVNTTKVSDKKRKKKGGNNRK